MPRLFWCSSSTFSSRCCRCSGPRTISPTSPSHPPSGDCWAFRRALDRRRQARCTARRRATPGPRRWLVRPPASGAMRARLFPTLPAQALRRIQRRSWATRRQHQVPCCRRLLGEASAVRGERRSARSVRLAQAPPQACLARAPRLQHLQRGNGPVWGSTASGFMRREGETRAAAGYIRTCREDTRG